MRDSTSKYFLVIYSALSFPSYSLFQVFITIIENFNEFDGCKLYLTFDWSHLIHFRDTYLHFLSLLINNIFYFILQNCSFRSALNELDFLENSIPKVQDPSCDNTSILGENFSKTFFGIFELFSSSKRDFSQVNLFSEIIDPLTIHGKMEYDCIRESSDKDCTLDIYYLYDMYSSLIRQITEKRKRLQYLLKRFG